MKQLVIMGRNLAAYSLNIRNGNCPALSISKNRNDVNPSTEQA